MTQPLKTFCQELLWNDDADNGTFFAVVLAPNDEVARRLIAAEMLEHNSDNLFELFVANETVDQPEPATLERYYRQHGELGAWEDIGGTACPNCTSHAGQPMPADQCEDHGVEEHAGAMVCGSCGYAWQPLGFGPARKRLEEEARIAIAQLDEIERASASNDEDDCGQCEGEGTTQTISNGKIEQCPVCDGTGLITK